MSLHVTKGENKLTAQNPRIIRESGKECEDKSLEKPNQNKNTLFLQGPICFLSTVEKCKYFIGSC